MKRTHELVAVSPRLSPQPVPPQPGEMPERRRPEIRQVPRSAAVLVVWPPEQGVRQAPAAVLPATAPHLTARPTADDELAASAGAVLCLAVRRGLARQVDTQLAFPYAAQAALAVSREGFNALGYAIRRNDADTAGRLLALSSGNEQGLQGAGTLKAPLVAAAFVGNAEIVDMLLHLPSARQQVARAIAARASPLVYAADTGHGAVVQRLLDSPFGAELAACADRNGVNALMAAAYKGHASVVQVMQASVHYPSLARGTDNAGSDALVRAAQQGHAAIVRLLLNAPHGMDMAGRISTEGYDALYIAAREGHVEVIRALLESPGYLEQRRAAGASRDPLAAALNNGHAQIVALLRNHGFGATAAGPQAVIGSGSSE